MELYETFPLSSLLSGNAYPGRGLVLGLSADGTKAIAAYFIMGRSTNSRNRVFLEEPDGIRTEAFDPALLQDPSLIIYHPVRECGRYLIVTNGDQTDTIRDYLKEDGSGFAEALATRCFEPDGPNWTPRISGLLDVQTGAHKLSILKSANADGSACSRFTYDYEPVCGIGHLLHTYQGDGSPLPSFQGEPKCVFLRQEIDAFTDMLWNCLDPDNKISLFVRYTDLKTGSFEQRILNKNQ